MRVMASTLRPTTLAVCGIGASANANLLLDAGGGSGDDVEVNGPTVVTASATLTSAGNASSTKNVGSAFIDASASVGASRTRPVAFASSASSGSMAGMTRSGSKSRATIVLASSP